MAKKIGFSDLKAPPNTDSLTAANLPVSNAGATPTIGTSLTGKEDVANKSTNVVSDGSSDTKYPSVKAVKDYADGLVTGLLDYRGGYDASVNVYPSAGGSGPAGAVAKGDLWIITVAGTLGGNLIHIGDSLIAKIDAPGQTSSNWDAFDTNLGYTPENITNKVTSVSGASTDVQYPSAKLLYDQIQTREVAGAAASAVSAHSGLSTGVHGVGAGTVAKVADIASDGNLSAAAQAAITASHARGHGMTSTSDHTDVASYINQAVLSSSSPTFANNTITGKTIFTASPATDHTASGNVLVLTATANTNFGDIGYIAATGKVTIAKADVIANANAAVMCADASIAINNPGNWLLLGVARDDSWSWSVGGKIYLSTVGTTGNTLTQTAPSASGNVVQIIGVALSATTMLFRPELVQVEIV